MTISLLEAAVELFGLFARDESARANIAAVGIMKRFFGAESAALFYVDGEGEHRFCLSGASFPIRLPESRWKESLSPIPAGAAVARFGPWSLPGFEKACAHWISSMLYSSDTDAGYVLLGRSSDPWGAGDERSLVSLAGMIAPIILVRIGREREEAVRRRAETRLAESESRLRAFFEDSRDMIYTADSEDVVTNVNAAGLALTGRAAKTDIVGGPFSSLVQNPAERALFLKRVREDGYASDYEIVLLRKDGGPVFCLETAHVLRGDGGEFVELQGIVKDISERIRNERELWNTNLELAAANQKLKETQALMVQQEKLASIGQLAAGVAHEINNPLGFLKSNHAVLERRLKLIRRAWEEARSVGGKAVEDIERREGLSQAFEDFDGIFSESADGLGRIVKIVGSLKNFSRIDQSGDFDSYDLNEGIASTLAVARNELKYVADIVTDFGELPRIRAKGGEVNQVILNILVNAGQAIQGQKRSGKGRIEIRTRARKDRVIAEIRDDGPGIPASIQKRIFDPFYTTKEPGKGTGLGLSISYEIVVAKHGGLLEVRSEEGSGATFVVVLPVEGPPGAGA